MTAIAVLTLLPEQQHNSDVRLWPFTDLGEAFFGRDRELLLESAANVLLFVPFGAALRLRGFGIAKTALFGLLASGIVELTQLVLVSGRTTSTDDLLLNTVGAIVGSALASRWAWIEDNRRPNGA